MPRSSSSDSNESRDRVRVEVRAGTHEDLREAAKVQAAAFFSVDADSVRLEVGGMLAEPVITSSAGDVILYRASMLVYFRPEPMERTILPASVPPRRSAAPSSRLPGPVGPTDDDPDLQDDDLDEDDDGLDD